MTQRDAVNEIFLKCTNFSTNYNYVNLNENKSDGSACALWSYLLVGELKLVVLHGWENG